MEEGSAVGTIGDNTCGDAGEATCYQRSRHSQDTRAAPFSKPPTEREKNLGFGSVSVPISITVTTLREISPSAINDEMSGFEAT